MPYVPKLRIAIIALLSAWMVLGPFWTQVLGQPTHWSIRRWRMYRKHANSVCLVEYYQQDAGGSRTRIDRLDTLGFDGDPPRKAWLLEGVKSLDKQGRQLCGHLGPDADVRVLGWCAGPLGWKQVREGAQNVCRLGKVR